MKKKTRLEKKDPWGGRQNLEHKKTSVIHAKTKRKKKQKQPKDWPSADWKQKKKLCRGECEKNPKKSRVRRTFPPECLGPTKQSFKKGKVRGDRGSNGYQGARSLKNGKHGKKHREKNRQILAGEGLDKNRRGKSQGKKEETSFSFKLVPISEKKGLGGKKGKGGVKGKTVCSAPEFARELGPYGIT